MDWGLVWRQLELEEQMENPWDWAGDHYHLDGWEINQNRRCTNKYLEEVGKELGVISLPHRHRHFGKV